MLEIINKRGEIMELDSSMSIPFEKNNTLFNGSSVFVEDLTYNGSAPITPSNKLFFNFGHRINTNPADYEFEISMSLNSSHICSGILTYKLSEKGFDFLIKPNFAAIRDKATTFNFSAVKFYDIFYLPAGKTYAQVLLDMATNPNNYPCVFIPVKNPYQFEAQDTTNAYPFVNYFDNNVYKPVIPSGVTPFNHMETPFFSLNYMLKKCCEFLGFTAEGSVFTDADFIKKKIYSRIAQFNPTGAVVYVDSSIYMPDMLIADFFKQINARYNLSCVFDFETRRAYIHTFKFLKTQSAVRDLSQYLVYVKEVNAPENTGFAISLKPDSTDDEFLVSDGDKQDYKPTNILTVGTKLSNTELDVSTLKTDLVDGKPIIKVSQLIQDAKNFSPNLTPTVKKEGRPNRDFTNMAAYPSSYYFPDKVADPVKIIDNKLRIVNYEGLVEHTAGQNWPKATADELNEKDAEFYNFLRNSKLVKAVFNIPSAIFSDINIFDRVAFFAEDGSYHYFLIQKITTDLKNGQFIKVEMLLRFIDIQQNIFTKVKTQQTVSSDKYSVAIHTDYSSATPIPFEFWTTPTTKFGSGNLAKTDAPSRSSAQIYTFTINKIDIPGGTNMQIRFYNRRPITATNALGITISIVDHGTYASVDFPGSDSILVNF